MLTGTHTEIGHEKAQSVIDSITSSYAAEGQTPGMPMFPGALPPPGGAVPGLVPGMPIPPPGMPGMPIPPPLPGMMAPGGTGGGFPPPFAFPRKDYSKYTHRQITC